MSGNLSIEVVQSPWLEAILADPIEKTPLERKGNSYHSQSGAVYHIKDGVGDEGHGGAFVEKGDGGGNLLGTGSELDGNPLFYWGQHAQEKSGDYAQFGQKLQVWRAWGTVLEWLKPP